MLSCFHDYRDKVLAQTFKFEAEGKEIFDMKLNEL